MVSDINLGNCSVSIVSTIFTNSFLLLAFYSICITPFVVVHRLGFSGGFFSLCSLCCLVFRDSIDKSCSSEIFSSAVFSLLIKPSKAFFIPVSVFDLQHFFLVLS